MSSTAETIRSRIAAAIETTHLDVTVVDAQCDKYAVVVVSAQFEGKNALAKTRMVNAAVGMSTPEMQKAIHALNITTKTPAEFAQ